MIVTDSGLVLIQTFELMQVKFEHLGTNLDEHHGDARECCGGVANISGCTEWLSTSHPYLSIGWDWVIDERGKGEVPWRLGPPRTNMNIVDQVGLPLQWNANLEELGQIIDSFLPWQQTFFSFGVLVILPNI